MALWVINQLSTRASLEGYPLKAGSDRDPHGADAGANVGANAGANEGAQRGGNAAHEAGIITMGVDFGILWF